MTSKIGPREQHLRALREARAAEAEVQQRQARKADLPSLREKVAAVPARKPKRRKL